MSGSDNDSVPLSNIVSNTRKRKSWGRLRDVDKHVRNHTFETGNPCSCRKGCFQKLSDGNKDYIIKEFNSLEDKNSQNRHLAGLISMLPVKRRRPRKSEDVANLRDSTFLYKIRAQNEENDGFHEISVCQQAFISLHGITNRRLMTIKCGLKRKGSSVDDMRGKFTLQKLKY